MTDTHKSFLKIRKRLIKAKAHAAKAKEGAADRKKQYEQDMLAHVMKHGKPQGF